jgi:hypothetical protein
MQAHTAMLRRNGTARTAWRDASLGSAEESCARHGSARRQRHRTVGGRPLHERVGLAKRPQCLGQNMLDSTPRLSGLVSVEPRGTVRAPMPQAKRQRP